MAAATAFLEGETQLNDPSDLFKAVSEAGKKFRGRVWWRGHGSINWQLVPSIYRCPGYSLDRERSASIEFVRRAVALRADCPGSDEWKGMVRWLFLMQHYGLPTRLLDWTESVLVAAYFAVAHAEPDTQGEDAAIWALNPGRVNHLFVNEDEIGTLGSKHWRATIAEVFATDRPRESSIPSYLSTVGEMVDQRMVVQQATFTLHGVPAPLEKAETPAPVLLRFRVPAKVRSQFWTGLEMAGINRSSLFPDLHHLALDIPHEFGLRPSPAGLRHVQQSG